MTSEFDDLLDVRGLNCPLPILKTKKQLVSMTEGQVLYVRATDPHSVIDFTAFCDKTGNELVRRWDEDGEYHFLVRKHVG
ncbi:MAG: sulfurtransferase TusA family protein [Ectothiorhodospiraceae bacterium]